MTKRTGKKLIILAMALLLCVLVLFSGCGQVDISFKRDKTATAVLTVSDDTIIDGEAVTAENLTDYLNKWKQGVCDVSTDKTRVSLGKVNKVDGGYTVKITLKDLTRTLGEGKYVFKTREMFFEDFNNRNGLLLMAAGSTNTLKKWDTSLVTPKDAEEILAFEAQTADGEYADVETLSGRTDDREYIFMFEDYFSGLVDKITLSFPGEIRVLGGQGVKMLDKKTVEITPQKVDATVKRVVNEGTETTVEELNGVLGFVLFQMDKSYAGLIIGCIAIVALGVFIFFGIKRKWFKKFHASKPAIFMRQNADLYLMMLPGAVLLFIFSYLPMSGIVLAFKNYSIDDGIFGSEWVGFAHFESLFFDPGSGFWEMLRNTVVLALLKMLVCFPASIIIALMFNEVRSKSFRKIIEIVSYMPFFISWVVVSGICYNFFSADNGVFNNIRQLFNLEPIVWYSTPEPWWAILTLSALWKGAGWGSIIYLAAIANVNTELYEASYMDGAKIMQRIWHVTIPGMMPIIIMQLILCSGNLIRDDFEQIMTMTNNAQELRHVTNVFSSVTYQQLLGGASGYGAATAIGLFQSVVALLFIEITNYIAKKTDNMTLW